ncbi:hypothetical protein ACLB2K_029992 [Fragaria x ananassa]
MTRDRSLNTVVDGDNQNWVRSQLELLINVLANGDWNLSSFSSFLDPDIIVSITAILLSHFPILDEVVWGPTGHEKFTIKSVSDLLQANTLLSHLHAHPPPSHIKWHPPPPNSPKANFDGSLLPPSCVASGFVVRNSDGIPILATSQNLGRLDILLAEDVALCVGMQLLATYTTQPINVEGDSKILLDALNGRSQIPWRLKVLVRDIQALSSHF